MSDLNDVGVGEVRPHRRSVVAAAALAGAVLVAACGAGREETQMGEPRRLVKVGVIVPLSGSLSALGVGIRNGADLAVRQANERKKIKGWTVVLDAQDDQGVPDVGANAAAKLSDDPAVVAVIGTFNSSVAEKAAPILGGRKIVMVSPANSNPTLTQGADPTRKVRPFPNYFRVVTTDAIQGPFAAEFAYGTLGARTVVVVHDKKIYGQGLALAFKAHFEKQGGVVPTVETVEPDDKDFSAVLAKLKRYRPDLIYYGGEYPAASLLTIQAEQQGLKMPLMSGDGVYSATYIGIAGRAAEGDYATSQGAPPDRLPAAKDFFAAYKAAGYPEPAEAFGPYAYDAANVIIEALAKVLPGQDEIDDPLRQRLRQAVQDINLAGVTGTVAFDEFGDTTTRVLTVYKVQSGAWIPQKTADFK
ncbi:MAG TPA: branched-chain amino acid ABC transporter substrate-binding protein [Acidimicrobiia bacterium]|nr:branched-chain amino acid ABC transporter substrate-binding protein [Acidimicrobiia bacterium]